MTCQDPLERAEGHNLKVIRRRGAGPAQTSLAGTGTMRRFGAGWGTEWGSGRDADRFLAPGARGSVRGAERRLCVRADRHRSFLPDDDRAFRLGRDLRLADILGTTRLFDAARRVPAACALPDGLFTQIRQRADAALHRLLSPICDSRHDRRGQSRPARVARLRPAFARATRRRCSPWCSGKARKSASSDLRSATLRAANGAPGPRSLLRRSATRGRSKNGRAIRWRAERRERARLRAA